MLESSFIYTIVRTCPESVLVVLAGAILLNTKPGYKTILKHGLLLGLIVSMIRRLPISFGVHTILGMGVYGLYFMKTSNQRPINIIIALCEIFMALVLSEGIYITLATKVFSLSEELIFKQEHIKNAIVTLPSLLIFIIIVIILNKVTTIQKMKNKG